LVEIFCRDVPFLLLRHYPSIFWGKDSQHSSVSEVNLTQVMGIVQALSPKPKLHTAFPLIPDNCLTAEDAEGAEENNDIIHRSFVASGLAPDVKGNVAHEVRRQCAQQGKVSLVVLLLQGLPCEIFFCSTFHGVE
jgi:hypothetical protein